MQRSATISLGLGLYFLAAATASARPATSSDIAGKTICWPEGYVEKYTADGKFISNIDGPGTWWFDDKGRYFWKLEKYPATFTGDRQINDDGTITYTGSIPGADRLTASGEYCNE